MTDTKCPNCAASTPSAEVQPSKVDNDMRIKVLNEMGFDYQCTRNEDGSLRVHIITQESNRGFFVNHTSLLCAMQRIPIALKVLAQAKAEVQPVDEVTVEDIAEILHIEVDTRLMEDMDCLALAYPHGLKIKSGGEHGV